MTVQKHWQPLLWNEMINGINSTWNYYIFIWWVVRRCEWFHFSFCTITANRWTLFYMEPLFAGAYQMFHHSLFALNTDFLHDQNVFFSYSWVNHQLQHQIKWTKVKQNTSLHLERKNYDCKETHRSALDNKSRFHHLFWELAIIRLAEAYSLYMNIVRLRHQTPVFTTNRYRYWQTYDNRYYLRIKSFRLVCRLQKIPRLLLQFCYNFRQFQYSFSFWSRFYKSTQKILEGLCIPCVFHTDPLHIRQHLETGF